MAEEIQRLNEKLEKIGGTFKLDKSVRDAFPNGTKILSAIPYGASGWNATARIDTIFPDGSPKRFFIKIAPGDLGRQMMEGEHAGMTAIHNVMPNFAPAPFALGHCTSPEAPDTHFFIMGFVNINLSKLPPPDVFCSRLAELHKTSISPEGKFGFGYNACLGIVPQLLEWDHDWARFFARFLGEFIRVDREKSGMWPELDVQSERLLTHVVPRLLGVLQSEGQSIKPCLVHGDLWEQNAGIDLTTGNPMIFDCAAFYAHNEYELGMWRRQSVRFCNNKYIRTYLKYFPPSEPVEEWDDRNRLYALKYNVGHACLYPGARTPTRDTILEDMTYLCNKYAPQPET